ncbi:MAG TPA: ATP-binding protein [Bacteroidales bacterium]|nr:ATP-binding protein [Bacteroidales bacterium]
MITRIASEKLAELASMFKAVAVIGPRQSGKTTLVKSLFPLKQYVNFENPDVRFLANEDPRGFLVKYADGAIFDEVQRVPQIFSYLQEILDNSKDRGKFILTGSNNFLLQENISQSLAGRVAYLQLLPFNLEELAGQNKSLDENEIIFRGFYPAPIDMEIPVIEWMPNYIRTYIERDVRQVKNITDLLIFERFMRLLASRTGQELNYSSLSIEVGVDSKTLQSWIGILESSFIIYLLRPHYKNFNKTVVKRPKLYFIDTGLACSLLGISTIDHLLNHPLRGSLFECFIVSELIKQLTHRGKEINLYYWRDKTGHEIDLIIDQVLTLVPVEIKSGKTVHAEFFKNLHYWSKLTGTKNAALIYAGEQEINYQNGIQLLSWKSLYRPFEIPIIS